MPDLSFLTSNMTAVAATAAATVTATFAAMKFYSDKAAKVTDFRKAWLETLRQAVAEFSGSTHTIAGRIAIRKVHHVDRKDPVPGSGKNWLARFIVPRHVETAVSEFDKGFETELLSHWSTLRLSYNKIILHQNPAEHAAYILAEETIAAYVRGAAPDPAIRENVSAFLHWCIRLADHETRHILATSPSIFPWRATPHRVDFGSKEKLRSEALEAACQPIKDACTNAGACMLLSVFATRQLLYGDYHTVFGNIWRIEHGIRTVDTAAAIVIKGVWEDIKKGEPAYRKISVAAISVPVILMLLILGVLFIPSASQAQKRKVQMLPAAYLADHGAHLALPISATGWPLRANDFKRAFVSHGNR